MKQTVRYPVFNGRKEYCDGHLELPLEEGFLIGEGMAMFGYHLVLLYIVKE